MSENTQFTLSETGPLFLTLNSKVEVFTSSENLTGGSSHLYNLNNKEPEIYIATYRDCKNLTLRWL